MNSSTPYLDALSKHFPSECSSIIESLSSEHARSAVDTLLAFASGGDCPTDMSALGQLGWARDQPAAMRAIQDLAVQKGTKRGREASTDEEGVGSNSKRPKTTDVPEDDRPIFTLPSISTTSPVRKKVDITIHEKTIRFVNPSSHTMEASIPISSISRIFLVPTRGKAKQHWTVVMLSSDVPGKGRATTSNPHQIIFGLDAISASKFDTTSYSASSIPSTSTVAKGEETLSVLREFLTHLPISLLEASATVFRSACATSKSGHCAAGIDAYFAAKPGTLWFFDSGVLWGESKPCEFWAVGDLIPKDGVRLISATGRTCSVILGRKISSSAEEHNDKENAEGDIVETEFSMVDGSAPPPPKATSGKKATTEERPSIGGNTATNGPAWDDSDSDDEDYEIASSEDIDNSSSSDSEASDIRSGSQPDDGSDEEDNRGSDANGEESGEESEEELQEAHHPLLRPGAMPRMSKATINAVIDMVNEDLVEGSEEEDELDDS
ncbi:uncharacterized protein BJ212DRAFT_1480648 [Suillus subaureus]|uniref:Histone chaperone RTT106/FACT complex subunit SPT16-like middle domain-containing protein n=1 Tax=Suillus subaureus TaxID=48587 RepID=A0A9P7ECE7_9AGAM|nr:uncharacterized protein BJ212DRAFT_1480648 [Suillus subaureus]KAG1816795.1 hypothetical protein BJ212DRAFT_1480648 [Suillus subaureus]